MVNHFKPVVNHYMNGWPEQCDEAQKSVILPSRPTTWNVSRFGISAAIAPTFEPRSNENWVVQQFLDSMWGILEILEISEVLGNPQIHYHLPWYFFTITSDQWTELQTSGWPLQRRVKIQLCTINVGKRLGNMMENDGIWWKMIYQCWLFPHPWAVTHDPSLSPHLELFEGHFWYLGDPSPWVTHHPQMDPRLKARPAVFQRFWPSSGHAQRCGKKTLISMPPKN